MSAFICTNETINAVVHAFQLMRKRNATCAADLELFTHEQSTDLGQQLYNMNAAAVADRYREEREKVRFVFRATAAYTDFLMFKAAQCLRYQCSEGDVPEWPLYKRLDGLIDRLARDIVMRSKDYDTAPWDLPDPARRQGGVA